MALRRRALTLTSNPHRAEDLVQTTLLKAWSSRDSFQPDTNLRAWLFTILRNTFFSEIRKYRREVEDVDGIGAESLSEEPRQEHAVALTQLLGLIARLPLDQRRPLVLMSVLGFSQQQAAQVCGCTVGTIKSRVSRSRDALERLMGQDDTLSQNRLRRSGGASPGSTQPPSCFAER
ncbi:sigma-70 family RNA polymerase sigma factor [Pseudotabrizicola formosa]|uniref:sigma-70 family RNA polymerase sigma factor n=1 Tax=Pseudotabrizicola formosa TaxID=2030009 RepID=UPI001AEF45A0|nr:sigma-70 family RNA polymerase sigma factor [Pseudotabrizicola formosa]